MQKFVGGELNVLKLTQEFLDRLLTDREEVKKLHRVFLFFPSFDKKLKNSNVYFKYLAKFLYFDFSIKLIK